MIPAAPVRADIIDRLPHRPPFRFVTRVRALDPGVRAQGEWDLSGREDFFAGHFPGEPVVPGVLLGEALAQLSGLVLFGDGAQQGTARLAMLELKFPGAVVPPALVVLASTLRTVMDGKALFEAQATHHDRTVAAGRLILATTRPAA